MSPKSDWRLAEWLAWQEQLHPRSIELGLERVRGVAHRLGLPDARAKTLTVAGTNGKGSSATLAALIYGFAGYRVGLYTSPHLLRYNERVTLDGAAATDEDLCQAFRAIDQARDGVSLTYFEFGTLAALWLFREARVNIQVLEVGLGGRLDAVNIVDTDCALITNIGLDHTDWLGPDRESIGREKAGILRAGRPAICVEESAPRSVLDTAAELAVSPQLLGRDFRFQAHDNRWDWQGAQTEIHKLPLPALRGAAQLRNAAGVLAAIESLQASLPVEEPAISQALSALTLPGRFERRGACIFDVGHNVEAAQVLVENLGAEKTSRILLVLGMLRDKPIESFCRVLAPLAERTFLAGLPSPRGLSADELAAHAYRSGMNCTTFATPLEALAAARAEANAGDTIVVTGSFMTVAAAYG